MLRYLVPTLAVVYAVCVAVTAVVASHEHWGTGRLAIMVVIWLGGFVIAILTVIWRPRWFGLRRA